MDVTLRVGFPLQGEKRISKVVDGKVVTYLIRQIEIQEKQKSKPVGEDIKKRLKGCVVKYDRPTDPAIPEEDWGIYQ